VSALSEPDTDFVVQTDGVQPDATLVPVLLGATLSVHDLNDKQWTAEEVEN
jgi:hypothetical protein